MGYKRFIEAAILLFLFTTGTVDLKAQQAGELITIDEPAARDLYLAGKSIHVVSEVNGDLVAAGQRLEVKQAVSGDIIAGGERINLRGTVGDDIRAAGRLVTVAGVVADDAILAGETVTIESGTQIGGRLWSAGRSIEIAGNVEDELRAIGQQITISGTVGGDALLIAEEIALLPGARIEGNLTYRSENEITIAQGATVSGTIERKKPDTPEAPEGAAVSVIFGILLSILVSVLVIHWVFSNLVTRGGASIVDDPFRCIGIGFVVLLLVPVLAIILMVTVLGLPLGLMVLAGYPVMLFFGFAVGLYALSNLILRLFGRTPGASGGWRIVAVALSLIIVFLLQFVPFVGGLLVLFTVAAGTGALALAFHLSRKAK